MRLSLYLFAVLIVGLIFSCRSSSNNKESTKNSTNTTKNVNTYTKSPYNIIDYDKSIINKDTLRLVTCNNFIYSPFGKIDSVSDLNNSLLKDFVVNEKNVDFDGKNLKLHLLEHEKSKLLFYFESDDPATHSSIYKGVITDADVPFSIGIKIGMSESSFFKYLPEKFKPIYNVVVLASCVDGIEHIYTFKNQRLASVNFVTDYIFDVDY